MKSHRRITSYVCNTLMLVFVLELIARVYYAVHVYTGTLMYKYFVTISLQINLN